MKNITLTNVSTAKVYLSIPNIHFNRELMPGRSISITEDEYREMTFDTGCMSLLGGHFLKVSGLEENEEIVPSASVYDTSAIVRMFDTQDITGFAKFIPNATNAEKDSVIKIAVDKGITHPAFVTLIKKYCDVDIINAINIKHQAEEK